MNNEDNENIEEEEIEENPEDKVNLVTVYTSTNNAIIALVKSMLDEAGIEYLAKGDNFQGIDPINAFPVDFQVMPENEEFARELLKDVEVTEGSSGYGYKEGVVDEEDSEETV